MVSSFQVEKWMELIHYQVHWWWSFRIYCQRVSSSTLLTMACPVFQNKKFANPKSDVHHCLGPRA